MEKRIRIASYIIFIIFGIFLLRLWELQIIKGRLYKDISERNRIRNIYIPAPRGIIYDRNHNPLVGNVLTFDVSIEKEDIPDDPEKIDLLAELLHINPDEIRERIERSYSPFEPIKLKQDVTFDEVAMIEARRFDLPGVMVEAVVKREYIYGRLASHVIGYLGYPTQSQLKDPQYMDIPQTTLIGQYGIEKAYDGLLRGRPGRRMVEVGATGRMVKVIGTEDPVKGKDITLTIDINLQKVAEESLYGKNGAIVVLDPKTGEVLAMASSPSFDPNLFATGITRGDWLLLINNPDKPLLNRATQGQYPPGSTFKIVSAIAGLEEGVIDEATGFVCNGGMDMGGRRFGCWRKEGHGWVDFYRAVAQSCDVYFYNVGKRLGIDRLERYARMLGLGSPTGIEIDGEKTGVVPSTRWKIERMGSPWYGGETLNTAIGQGYLTATPLQMARLVSAVVNGGRLYKVHLLKDTPPQIERTIDISRENEYLLRKALMGVVENGTGRMAYSRVVRIGGKTGTAQSGARDNKDHAWFVAFAPEDDPELAVSVLIEHGGHGGAVAAPIAKGVIEAYFSPQLLLEPPTAEEKQGKDIAAISEVETHQDEIGD
ncbi:MAG: penicillin-binding protein 2 [Thermodesulfovibrionia bacterium]